MNRTTLHAFHDDPELIRRLRLAAHRERSLAMTAGLVWLREYAKKHLAPLLHARPWRWTERLG